MDAPYFIKEHLWMASSDEATLKFSLWERQTFRKRGIFCHKKIFSVY